MRRLYQSCSGYYPVAHANIYQIVNVWMSQLMNLRASNSKYTRTLIKQAADLIAYLLELHQYFSLCFYPFNIFYFILLQHNKHLIPHKYNFHKKFIKRVILICHSFNLSSYWNNNWRFGFFKWKSLCLQTFRWVCRGVL